MQQTPQMALLDVPDGKCYFHRVCQKRYLRELSVTLGIGRNVSINLAALKMLQTKFFMKDLSL